MKKTLSKNEFKIVRRIDDRVVRVYANYRESTDDWNIVCFIGDQSEVFDARVTTDVLSEAAGMIQLAMAAK